MTAIMIQQLTCAKALSAVILLFFVPFFTFLSMNLLMNSLNTFITSPAAIPQQAITAAVWIWLCISWLIGVF